MSKTQHEPRDIIELDGQTRWLDYTDITPVRLAGWSEQYAWHPLITKTLHTPSNARVRLAEYDDTLLVTLKIPDTSPHKTHYHMLFVLLKGHEIVTIHDRPLEIIELVKQRLSGTQSIRPDKVLAVLLEELADQFNPIIDEIDEKIDALEDLMIGSPTDDQLRQIFSLKQQLIGLRRVVTPTSDVLNGLSGNRYPQISSDLQPYFRDSYDYVWRMYELIDSLRDLLSSALDTYLSVVSNRLNEVMKRLTIIATIFLPISFVVGLGGINFPQFPFKNNFLFMIIISSLIILPASMMIYFRRKKWL